VCVDFLVMLLVLELVERLIVAPSEAQRRAGWAVKRSWSPLWAIEPWVR
jgi:hypothetical protein